VNKFGMDNGLPIDAEGSGYDPSHPFSNRDPRFYYDFVLDRDTLLYYTTAYPLDKTAKLYLLGNDGMIGRHRENNALTGIGQKKLLAKGANSRDNRWGNQYYYTVPLMRLAHVYLMYAEAANEGYDGPNGTSPGGITAVQAVNMVRARANVPDLDARFLAGKDVFRQAVRNEIGVEMCLESHQWYDYRRWHIAHLLENRTKSALDYDENWTYFSPRLLRTINFDQARHYWLPFRVDDVSIYPEFYQNPGW
jgi:hypothetical protein